MTGALLAEYLQGFKVQKKMESYVIVRVHAHKTGLSETAKLVLSRDTLRLMTVSEEVRLRNRPTSSQTSKDSRYRI